MNNATSDSTSLAPTGIPGLDAILRGGLPRRHMYLIQGETGTGKTTLGMQFLLAGVQAGESAMLVALAETEADLHEIARSHGWTLDGIDLREVTPADVLRRLGYPQTVFPTAEVELSEITDEIVSRLRATRPQRVLFDAITELRLLAGDPIRYRHQILALRNVLDEIQATALFTDTTGLGDERLLDSLVHGILRIERWAPDYGPARRRIEVAKVRGRVFQEGWHDFDIQTGGIRVFPRPRHTSGDRYNAWEQLPSGNPELDDLLGGGLEMGAITTFAGSSGTGKSTLASLFLHAGLQKGLSGAAYLFDERAETLLKRAGDLGIALRPYVESGRLAIRHIGTAEVSPGQLADDIYRQTRDGARLVLVDSLNGYRLAVPGADLLLNQLQDQLTALRRLGVLSLVNVTNHGLFGADERQEVDFSYLSDTVVLLRHFEAAGALHLAISVVKKRHGVHEKTIRELRIRPGGIAVGPPLSDFHGVLTGNPVFQGDVADLLGPKDDDRV